MVLKGSKGELVNRNGFPILPYLDPQFNPDHPVHHRLQVEEDPYLPLGPRERRRLEKEAFQQAMDEYAPPHVPRSWETHSPRADQRTAILNLILTPKMDEDYLDLLPSVASGGGVDPAKTDFRTFAKKRLHLGYNRFHTFGSLRGEPEEVDLPTDEVCWIMEYTYNECNTIRRKIALAMGEFPAVTDEENPLYNAEIAWRYERRLYCRCRRRNRFCIRPSHIEIFTSSFQLLP